MPPRRAVLGLPALLAARPAAADPRAPVRTLVEGLAARPDEAALRRLLAETLDVAAAARLILAGLPGAEPAAEQRLAAVLEARFLDAWRQRPPEPAALEWIEDRPLPGGGALVLTRLARPGGVSVLAWQVQEGPQGPRILDLQQDGVSLMRTQRAELSALVRERGMAAALLALEAGPRR